MTNLGEEREAEAASGDGQRARDVALLVVEVASRRSGLLSTYVREVQPAVRLMELPEAPAVVDGVFNMRGDVVPVVSLRTRLRLDPRPVRPSDRLVIVDVTARRFALRVDAAVDLFTVPAEEIRTASATVPEADYLAGVATLADGLLVIHDLHAFLSADEGLAVDDAVTGVASDRERWS